MREIKFRGKTYATAKWKYGDLIKPDIIFVNENELEFLVDKNTIGQYTGLKDKNGKEIYEGDIVEVSEEGRMLFGSREHLTRKYSLIGFHDGAFMLGRNEIDFSRMDTYLCVMKDYISVVGNIYENKNLLEKENK